MKYFFVSIITVCMFMQACNNEKKTDTDSTSDTTIMDRDTTSNISVNTTPGHAQAILSGTKTDTTVNGTVNFDTLPGGKVKMMLELTVTGMGGKTVSVHIHEHGDCGEMGENAHAHWNPGNAQHGKWGSSSFHAGDIGNVKLDKDGRGTLTLETDRWAIGGGTPIDLRGKAIIVHSGTDDYKTQPSGNSGSRIGCGVIQ